MHTNDVARGDLVGMYRLAATIKECDETVRRLLKSGALQVGTYHPPRGQELISAAMGTVLTPTDYVVTTYRGLGDQIAKGVPLRELIAEFYGRSTGASRGKGGPMHVTHQASRLMVTTGVVGSGLPIANGLALSSRLMDLDEVTVVTFGDGATNIGAFHEALNLAGLWNLPIVYLCSNNLYAEYTTFAASTKVERLSARADSYGVVGETVNGNDPVEILTAVTSAVERARAGDGPTLIEAMTYRLIGHSWSDDLKYAPADEVEAHRNADPMPAMRAQLVAEDLADEEALAAIDAQIKEDVLGAVEFAQASSPPEPDALYRDVYAEVSA